MAVTLQRPEPQSGSSCIPTQSVGMMSLYLPTISLAREPADLLRIKPGSRYAEFARQVEMFDYESAQATQQPIPTLNFSRR